MAFYFVCVCVWKSQLSQRFSRGELIYGNAQVEENTKAKGYETVIGLKSRVNNNRHSSRKKINVQVKKDKRKKTLLYIRVCPFHDCETLVSSFCNSSCIYFFPSDSVSFVSTYFVPSAPGYSFSFSFSFSFFSSFSLFPSFHCL